MANTRLWQKRSLKKRCLKNVHTESASLSLQILVLMALITSARQTSTKIEIHDSAIFKFYNFKIQLLPVGNYGCVLGNSKIQFFLPNFNTWHTRVRLYFEFLWFQYTK